MQAVTPNTITHQQRKLYWAILTDIMDSDKDIEYYGLTLPTKGVPTKTLHFFLRMVNDEFPRDDKGFPISTARGQISTKDMGDHIRWLELCCLESGITMLHYETQMRRLDNLSGINTILK